MHAVGSLLLGTVSNGGPQADDCGLALLLARFSDRIINRRKIAVEKCKHTAAYSQESLTYLPHRHGEPASRKKGSVVPHFR